MSYVMFATLCDKCGKKSPKYTSWLTCTECMDDVCDECDVAVCRDEKYGDTVCKECGGTE